MGRGQHRVLLFPLLRIADSQRERDDKGRVVTAGGGAALGEGVVEVVPAVAPACGGNGNLGAVAGRGLAPAGGRCGTPGELVMDMDERGDGERGERVAVDDRRRMTHGGAGVFGNQRQDGVDQRFVAKAEAFHQSHARAALGRVHAVLEQQRFFDGAANRLADQFPGRGVVASTAQRLGTRLGRNAHGDLVGARTGCQLG